MNIASLSVATLKQAIVLVEQKEKLQAEVARIDAVLAGLGAGQRVIAPAASGRVTALASKARGKRAKRGEVKAAIVELVRNSGKSGITVKDISSRLGIKYAHVFAWFYTTGSKIKEIKKVGPGKYGWAGGTGGATASATKMAVKPAAKPASGKAKTGKPAVSKDTVIAMIKGAGSSGISVLQIAGRLGVNAQRIYTWFNAVGKKVKEIKKVAPATYAWVS